MNELSALDQDSSELLENKASRTAPTPTLIVGIGSPHGDDIVGWEVVNRLQTAMSSLFIIKSTGSPMRLLDWLKPSYPLHVIDACQSGKPAGTIFKHFWPDATLQQQEWSGTHDFNLPSVLQLAEQLRLLPDTVVVWGVEGTAFGSGAVASPDIQLWAKQCAALIQQELMPHKG